MEHRGNPHAIQNLDHAYVTECVCGMQWQTFNRAVGVESLRHHIARATAYDETRATIDAHAAEMPRAVMDRFARMMRQVATLDEMDATAAAKRHERVGATDDAAQDRKRASECAGRVDAWDEFITAARHA